MLKENIKAHSPDSSFGLPNSPGSSCSTTVPIFDIPFAKADEADFLIFRLKIMHHIMGDM
jgi:hypothetical protein